MFLISEKKIWIPEDVPEHHTVYQEPVLPTSQYSMGIIFDLLLA